MTTEEIGPNIKISWAETKKSAARHEKVLRKFRTTFPCQSTGTMLQVPRGQALYIERIRRLKALVLGKNMDKKKVADQIMYFVC